MGDPLITTYYLLCCTGAVVYIPLNERARRLAAATISRINGFGVPNNVGTGYIAGAFFGIQTKFILVYN